MSSLLLINDVDPDPNFHVDADPDPVPDLHQHNGDPPAGYGTISSSADVEKYEFI
jgi:hypothetical protein